MITMLAILWILSLIVLITGPKSYPNRYCSFILFFLGMGFAAKLFRSNIIPIIADKYPPILNPTIYFNTMLFSFSTYFPPYFLLTYSLTYSDIIRFKSKRGLVYLKIILFMPVVLMFVFVCNTPLIPVYKTNYFLLSIWTIPYMFFSYALIILAYLREKIESVKLIRLVNIICIIPSYTILTISEVILPIFKEINRMYLYFFLIVYIIVCFSFLALKSTFFGIKITYEKNKHIYENRINNSYISMLNHSIKNEVSKISMCASYLNDQLGFRDETLDIITESSVHLLNIINKLNFQAGELEINCEFINLEELVKEVLLLNKFLLEENNIKCTQDIASNLVILCDRVHFKELLNNIIKNSIEAIENSGTICIHSSFENKYLVILIKDNGCGILEKDIPNITEPFFSTKGTSQNYGIGLYYCKKVIHLHGGFIDIKSKVGLGTDVYIYLSKKPT